MKEIIVIGGGIIGLTAAYYLSEQGHNVTVIDRGEFTDGCSFGNAGLIVPSHITPLAAPGILKQGLKWMLKKKSPLSISPTLKPSFLNWCVKFAKSSANKNTLEASKALRDIGLYSSHLYSELANNSLLSFNHIQSGLMMLFQSEKVEEEEIKLASVANDLGIKAEILSRSDAKRLQGNMDINARGAVFYPGDSHLEPSLFINSILRKLQENNVVLKNNCSCNELIIKDKKINGVQTSKGLFFANEIIISAGVWSNRIATDLNLKLRVQAGKGYSFKASPNKILRIPSILLEPRVAITPYSSYTRFAGVMELGAQKQRINLSKITGMHQAIQSFLPEIDISFPEVNDIWSGLRPCSVDGLPYIGRTKKYHNLIIATGHSMLGVALAPATGKIISELIEGKDTSIDIGAFSPDRG